MLDEISIRQCVAEKDGIEAGQFTWWSVGAKRMALRRGSSLGGASGRKASLFISKGLFSKRLFSSDYLTVSVLPPCAIACINTCAHVKNSKYWQLCTIVWTQKSCTLWWREWVALLMRLLQPSPGKATRIFRKGLVK